MSRDKAAKRQLHRSEILFCHDTTSYARWPRLGPGHPVIACPLIVIIWHEERTSIVHSSYSPNILTDAALNSLWRDRLECSTRTSRHPQGYSGGHAGSRNKETHDKKRNR